MLIQILKPFLPLFIFMFIIFCLAAFFKTPFFKGWLGETMVNIALKMGLHKKQYHLIKNVTVPTDDGTTQIDHVVVSVFGIFVIETKNMKGWIFGSQKDSMWTQKIFKYTNKFQNPLRQNYKHTQTLAKILEVPGDAFISVVVFVGDSEFKTEMPPNVVSGVKVLAFIKSHTKPILNEAQVETVIARIAEKRLAPGLVTHVKHVQHVKSIVRNKETAKSRTSKSDSTGP